MVQTPAQRRANEKFAKHEASKRGKSEAAFKQQTKLKSPISNTWILLLAFVVFGPLLFELVKLLPHAFSLLTGIFKR